MLGTKLSDRYEIAGELGRGGMGVVYRAMDPVLGRDVAVKLIPPQHVSAESEQRFQREAQLVAQMDHPSIVPIYDFGRHGDALFLVMPVVPGTSLRPLLRDKALLLGDVVDIGIQLAEALAYSHARGVVHRDIKPENIMVERDEMERLRARLMDFGLAKVSTRTQITQTGMLVGTMAYLSPEQITAKDIGPACDIYSLATVLYECLVGKPPFAGEVQSLLYRVVHELPAPPSTLGVEIDSGFEELVLSCMAKEPAQRPKKASAVADALRSFQARMRESDRKRSIMLPSSWQGTRPALPPFVGREKELGELQQRLNAALAGECQFAAVGGEPGIGKTRLLDELGKLAQARGARVLHGRFVEQDRAFPYQGFSDVIQEYFLQKETGSSSSELPDFSDLASDLVALFPMLAEIGEIRAAATVRPPEPAAEDRTRVFELLARTITRLAGGKPLVLLLEDLHDAEVSLDALQYVIRRLGPTPTLIVGTYRTSQIDRRHALSGVLAAFHGDRRFVSLVLGPFSSSEHRSLLETIVGAPQLASDLVERLYEATEGNPFFAKELVRSFLDAGTIAKDDTGTWTLSGQAAITTDALPATIQQAVETRIERLPDDLRDVLNVASVLGRSFDFRDLEALAGKDLDAEAAVDRLIAEGLLEEERESRGDRIAFASGVVRDVLYAQLARRKRRSLHRSCGEQLEKRLAGRLETVYPDLLYHFSEGDVPEKTVEYGLSLGRRSLDRFSPEEAARAVRTALEFLDEEWEGERALEGEARLLLARVHRHAGDVDAALKQAEAAVAVLEREGQPERVAEGLLLAAETAWHARRPDDTGRFVDRGMEAARAAGETETLKELLSLGATLANLRGAYDRANELLREAADLGVGTREVEGEAEAPRGGRLVVPLLNPVKARELADMELAEEAEVLTNVFETLVATDEGGSLVPWLCEKWQVLEEGRVVLLTLRTDVQFQDGTPLTAAAVKRSFERAIRRNPKKLPAAYAALAGVEELLSNRADDVGGLVVRSDGELEIRLSEPLPIYPAFLADFYTGIARESGTEAVGTGPFKIAAHEATRIVLERNEGYWRGAPARLDTIEFRPGLPAAAIAAGLRAGELDLARDLLPEDLEGVHRDPRLRAGHVETPQKNTFFVLFNTQTGPVARRPEVRRALAGVVQTTDLVWRTLGRFGQPATCLIAPGILGHDPGRRRPTLKAEDARALLESTGLALPFRLKGRVHPLLQDRWPALVDALRALWSEIGVEITVVTSTVEEFFRAWEHNEGLDFLIPRWNADYDDPDNFTHTLFHSRAGQFKSYFSSAETDQLLAEARAEGRSTVRQGHYRKFESALAEDGVLVPLFHEIDYRIASPKVRGLRLRSSPPYVNYAEIGKAEKETSAPAVRQARGTLHVPISTVVTELDPCGMIMGEQAEVVPAIFESLTRHVEGGRIAPCLAEEYRAESGGSRYRFRLREDARFHDGRRLTARDVRHSYERLLQEWEYRGLLSPIRGAKRVIDGKANEIEGFRIHSATEFTVELERPLSFFPVLLAHPGTGIVPEGTTRMGRSWQDGFVGTGPFRVVDFDPGRRLELERNPGYWRPDCPRAERLVFSFDIPPKDILAGFREGRFSLCSDLLPADVEALRRDPTYASGYRESPHLSTHFVAFNTQKGPLRDRDLRRALVQGIDVPALVRQTVGRLAIPARGLIPPGLLGHDPGQLREVIAPAAGKEPLKGQELTATVHPHFQGKYSAIARQVLEMFRGSGVETKRVGKTIGEYAEAVDSGSADLVIGRWIGDYADADTFVHGVLHSEDGFFGRICGSPAIDTLVEQARAEPEPATRHALYRGIEEIISREALLLPLFHEQVYRFARPEVEGLTVSFGAPVVRYENLHVRG